MHHEGHAPAATLVTIRAGARSSAALFCLPAQAGDVSLYEPLARHLPSGWRVLGLRAPAPPAASFEQLAATHVEQITAVQPEGPYLLLGECTGGALAYEVACQLRGQGHAVALLALIDAFAPGQPRLRSYMPAGAYRFVHRLRILTFHAINVIRLPLAAKLSYVGGRLVRMASKLRSRLAGDSTAAASASATFAGALTSYAPGSYDAPVLLLRAERLPLGIEPAPAMGWGELVAELHIERIPGYHTTPISEPHVRTLAVRLARHLPGADSEA